MTHGGQQQQQRAGAVAFAALPGVPQREGAVSEEPLCDWTRGRWRNSPYLPWGQHNTYPDYLAELYTRNPVYRTVTARNGQLVAGEGLHAQGGLAEAWVLARLEACGAGHRLAMQLAADLALYNGCAVRLTGTGAALRVEHVPFGALRLGREPARAEIWLSPAWHLVDAAGRPTGAYAPARPTVLPDALAVETNAPRVLRATLPSPVSGDYPLPDGASVSRHIELATSIVEYQRNYVENGMASTAILYVPFSATEPPAPGEMFGPADAARLAAVKAQAQRELIGPTRAGQPVMIAFDPLAVDAAGTPTGAPRFAEPPASADHERFTAIQAEIQAQLLTGLGVVSAELYGLGSPSGFASQAEQLKAAARLTETYVAAPKRAALLEIYDHVLAELGMADVRVGITTLELVDADQTLELYRLGVLTLEEAREALGYPAVPSTPNP